MKIERSGLIPFIINDDNIIEMMFMKPSDPMYGGEHYQIAKGKIEVGEGPLETAIRESHEELGLRHDNIDDMVYCGKFLGRTEIFAALMHDKDAFDPFHTDETESVMWMTLNEFAKIGRDIHLDVVEIVHREMRNRHITDNE